jgi:hypothetical protein
MSHDFSGAVIHTGSSASASAQALHARAYTIGNHIVFGAGQFQPETHEGKKLLAHELVHVAQNGRGTVSSQTVSRETSTKLPKDAKKDSAGDAHFLRNNKTVEFIIEPDKKLKQDKELWHGKEVAPAPGGAVTKFHIDNSYGYDTKNGMVSKVTAKYKIYICTFYAKGVDPAAASAYGRGTTKEDIKAGATTLRHHEGAHGQDFQDYVQKTPPPDLPIKLPATPAELDAAVAAWNEKVSIYSAAVEAYSEQHTDEVGIPKSTLANP